MDGKVVIRNGKITTFNEEGAVRKFREILESDMNWQKEIAQKEAAEVFPVFEKAYFRTLRDRYR